MLNGINGFDGFQNVFYGIVHRILARFNGQTLMPHILKGDYLPFNLLLGQLYALYMFILHMIGTVYAAVYAVVGEIQGSEHNYSVAVKGQFDFLGQFIHFLDFFGNFAGQQHRGFAVG